MILIRGEDNADSMLRLYATVLHGPEQRIRGAMCRNVRDAVVTIDSNRAPITNFRARKLNLRYAKREWLWYLGADRFDDSIAEHATMWKKLKQPDGSYFSNYGQYIFGPRKSVLGRDGAYMAQDSQFDYVISTLKMDKNSRRASMVLLKSEHLFAENIDTVCTYAINFAIERSTLHMTVMMRSNDVVFGFTNDSFCFWNLHTFVYAVLRETYHDLEIGSYTHLSNSMHVYDHHYDMLSEIVKGGPDEYEYISVPRPSVEEVLSLVITRGKGGQGAYTDWLKA